MTVDSTLDVPTVTISTPNLGSQSSGYGSYGSSSAPTDTTLVGHENTNLKFWVQIDSVVVAFFTECSPLVITTTVKEFNEGGVNSYTHKVPIRTTYENITLKYGHDDGQYLYNWFVQNINGPQSSTGNDDTGEEATSSAYRQNISIIVFTADGVQKKRWDLMNAYPVKWTGSDFHADNTSNLIQSVEIAHEGLIVTS